MADVPIVEGGSDFRLMNSKALGTLKRFREHGRFLRGIVGALGYRQAELHFVAPPRFAGVSKFSVRKMIRFALDGVTAFSRVPLRAALYVGVLCGGMSFFAHFTSFVCISYRTSFEWVDNLGRINLVYWWNSTRRTGNYWRVCRSYF